jgi:hypothetical protein
MAAPKGHQRYGGREKGVPNKSTQELKDKFNLVWSENVPKINEALEQVYMEDPARFLEILAKYAQYFVPKKVEQDTNLNMFTPPTIVIKKDE